MIIIGAIKKGQILTPVRGLTDTTVKGTGLIDLTGPRPEAPESGKYIDLSLELFQEAGFDYQEELYATLHLTNNYEALVEEGVDAEVAGKIVAATDLLASALRTLIFRGGKYGGI